MMTKPQRCAVLVALMVALSAPHVARAQDVSKPSEVPPAPATNGGLDPESPMAEMPDIGVAWPDIKDAPVEGDQSPTTTTEIADDRRYEVVVEGLKSAEAPALIARFDSLSALKAGESKPANIAQIDRRAREDADLLDQLLRAGGYYDANVDTRVEPAKVGNKLLVIMTIESGPLYRFSDVQVSGLESEGDRGRELRDVFAIDPRDPVDADDVVAAETALKTTIAKEGYPFAVVGEPDVVVDHETRTATLAMKVEPGGQQQFGQIIVKSANAPFGARHIARIARFKVGETYNQDRIDDLRRAIIATGLVSSVKLEPVPAAAPKTVDMAVSMEPAPMHTIAAEAGYGTGEGIRVEASWTHRNLIRPEGAVTIRGIVGTLEQSLGAVLRQSNFGKRDQVLNGRISASNINRKAYDARTFEIAGSIERQTNIIWQKKWTWSAGFELLASDERDIAALGTRRQRFFIGALPAALAYDGSNDLLDPTRGFRLSARISPELSLQSGTFGYVRAQVDGSFYLPLGQKLVVAGRGRIGTIVGASSTRLAPSRRFYSGGGGSVRGYSFQDIGPRDAFNDPVGGRGLAEFSLEARVRIGNFGIVPFIDGGNIYSKAIPDFSGFRYGAGVGLRYHSSFGPIRIDVATPINPRAGDAPVAVYVSLGQAF
jgi:translocation and assembly module TamA